MLFSFNAIKKHSQLAGFSSQIIELSNNAFALKNGNFAKWNRAFEQIQQNPQGIFSIEGDYLKINTNIDEGLFKHFMPWRKGPFKFDNFALDSEWNGNIKWQKLQSHLDFANKTVLDVGCGNGYFSFKMQLLGAQTVVGLEPFFLFNYQFQILKYLSKSKAMVFPLRLEVVPDMPVFDYVFSMGVLYHHKSPIEHILKLKKMLATDGILILETLVVEGDDGYSLLPKNRYAQMRNVWFIPSIATLKSWLYRCGFNNINVIDNAITSTTEQQKTKWIGENSQSLEDFVVGDLTIEGYPRPQRSMLLCKV